MKVHFACPQCDDDCAVELDGLAGGVRCPRCAVRFPVADAGRFSLRQRVRRTRLRCVQCRAAASVVSTAIVRGGHCAKCNAPLAIVVDQPSAELKEHAELARAAGARPAAPSARAASAPLGNFSDADPAGRRVKMLMALLAIAGFLAGLMQLMPAALGEKTVEQVAADFTHACLAGEFERAAGKFVGEDSMQQAQFERWTILNFASIQKKFRPPGDQPVVEVHQESASPPIYQVRVTMRAAFFGERTLDQYWRQDEDGWKFDAARTVNSP